MKLRELRPKKFKSKGFTLIELLVVVAITSLIILSILSLYSIGQRYFLTGSARTDVLRNTRQVLNLENS